MFVGEVTVVAGILMLARRIQASVPPPVADAALEAESISAPTSLGCRVTTPPATPAIPAGRTPVDGARPRPGGLPRALIILVGAAAIVVVVAGVQAVAWLIGPAFMALIVVIAVAPAQGWLRRHNWPRWATTLVVDLLVYAILIGLALGIIFSVARLAAELPK